MKQLKNSCNELFQKKTENKCPPPKLVAVSLLSETLQDRIYVIEGFLNLGAHFSTCQTRERKKLKQLRKRAN